MNPTRNPALLLLVSLTLVGCGQPPRAVATATSGGGTTGGASSTGTTGTTGGAAHGTAPICAACRSDAECLSGYCNASAGLIPFCDTPDFCLAGQCGDAACLPSGACDCHPDPVALETSPTGSTGSTGGTGWHGAYKGCEGCLVDPDCLNGGHCQVAQGDFVGHCEGASCSGPDDCGHSPGLVGSCQASVCACQP